MTALTRNATSLAGSGLKVTTVRHMRTGIDGRPVPLLRGRLHQFAVVPAATAGVTTTAAVNGMAATTAVAIFTFSIVAMLTASAVYHCHAAPGKARQHAQRVDHAMILIAIAGTQTAYWIALQPATTALVIVTPVWLAATAGFGIKLRGGDAISPGGDWLFAFLGLTGVALLPSLASADIAALLLIAAGGAVYALGGALLRLRIGNIYPTVFGYHEVWHALVLAGAICHYLALLRLISAAAQTAA